MKNRPGGMLWFVTIAMLTLAGGCGFADANPGEWAGSGNAPPLRRVILISCDTLSAQHLQSYGYAKETTTVFDALAAKGVLFRHCLAPQGWTLTSHMTMLTGLLPGVHRVGKYSALPESIPTLPELLQEQGFRTAFLPTDNEWLRDRYGFDRGFDQHHMYSLQDPIVLNGSQWFQYRAESAPGEPAVPFFVMFHFMDVHSRPHTFSYPYSPLQRGGRMECDPATTPKRKHFLPIEKDDLLGDIRNWDLAAYDPAFLRCAYDACVSVWDSLKLGELTELLDEGGHLRDTLLIVTADHGEELGEHGGYFHDSPYGEVREVPLLLVWPGRLPEGAVVEARVGLADLAPTILELAGVPAPPSLQGLSLAPLLEDTRAPFPDRDFLIDGNWRGWAHFPTALVAKARGSWWSLVAMTDTTGTTGTFAPETVAEVHGLFDLDRDPLERDDLQTAMPDLVTELIRRIEAQLAANAVLARDLAAAGEGEPASISEEAARKLRALGY